VPYVQPRAEDRGMPAAFLQSCIGASYRDGPRGLRDRRRGSMPFGGVVSAARHKHGLRSEPSTFILLEVQEMDLLLGVLIGWVVVITTILAMNHRRPELPLTRKRK